jgi:hypothetical protein
MKICHLATLSFTTFKKYELHSCSEAVKYPCSCEWQLTATLANYYRSVRFFSIGFTRNQGDHLSWLKQSPNGVTKIAQWCHKNRPMVSQKSPNVFSKLPTIAYIHTIFAQ